MEPLKSNLGSEGEKETSGRGSRVRDGGIRGIGSGWFLEGIGKDFRAGVLSTFFKLLLYKYNVFNKFLTID